MKGGRRFVTELMLEACECSARRRATLQLCLRCCGTELKAESERAEILYRVAGTKSEGAG